MQERAVDAGSLASIQYHLLNRRLTRRNREQRGCIDGCASYPAKGAHESDEQKSEGAFDHVSMSPKRPLLALHHKAFSAEDLDQFESKDRSEGSQE